MRLFVPRELDIVKLEHETNFIGNFFRDRFQKLQVNSDERLFPSTRHDFHCAKLCQVCDGFEGKQMANKNAVIAYVNDPHSFHITWRFFCFIRFRFLFLSLVKLMARGKSRKSSREKKDESDAKSANDLNDNVEENTDNEEKSVSAVSKFQGFFIFFVKGLSFCFQFEVKVLSG
jgi:hypothetical protein